MTLKQSQRNTIKIREKYNKVTLNLTNLFILLSLDPLNILLENLVYVLLFLFRFILLLVFQKFLYSDLPTISRYWF